MTTAGELSLTMKDWLASRQRGNEGVNVEDIVEILDEVNPILDDAKWMEANNATHHRTNIRSGLPEVYWRTLNRGVPRSKSTMIQVDDRIGILESWSAVDADLADLNAERQKFLLSEEVPFIESMGQEVSKSIFYGDLATNPAGFLGLTPRYSTLDTGKAGNAENVISCGGANVATNTSMWLCGWGDRSLHMTYPKGMKMGLSREYLGRKEILDPAGNEYMGYKSHYSWKAGLVLRDWRYTVRLCNIDAAALPDMLANGASDAAKNSLYRYMIDAYNRIPSIGKIKPVWYAPREVCTMLDVIAAEKSNVNLSIGEFEGKKVTMVKGIPLRREDALEIGEPIVV